MKCTCCLSHKITPKPFSLRNYFICHNCGLVFRESCEVPGGGDDLIRHYQNKDPHKEVALAKQSFFESALAYLDRSFSKSPKTLLDIGCGHGYFLKEAGKHGWKTAGIDIDKEALQDASEMGRCDAVFCGDINEVNSSSFEVVTLWDVLMFFPDPAAKLAGCFDVLKEGGKVGIRVRNVVFQQVLFQFFSPFKSIAPRFNIPLPYVFHPLNFSARSIQHLLRRAGFVNITIVNSPLSTGDPYRHFQLSTVTLVCKQMINCMADIIFRLSGGRLIVGPSLLVWADKPKGNLNG